jgi:NAD(P)-dependent dehydrogenase (short-subunit alcohol dehydrogenase family)
MTGRLEKKVAIVTGGGSGEATANRSAEEGAHVFVTDINSHGAERVVAEIQANGGAATAR